MPSPGRLSRFKTNLELSCFTKFWFTSSPVPLYKHSDAPIANEWDSDSWFNEIELNRLILTGEWIAQIISEFVWNVISLSYVSVRLDCHPCIIPNPIHTTLNCACTTERKATQIFTYPRGAIHIQRRTSLSSVTSMWGGPRSTAWYTLLVSCAPTMRSSSESTRVWVHPILLGLAMVQGT